MEKQPKDLVSKKCILNLVDKPKRWLSYMQTEHLVELFWWEDLIEKKRGLLQERQAEHAKDLSNQIFQTF